MAAPQRTTVAEAVGIGGRRNTQPTHCAAAPPPFRIQWKSRVIRLLLQRPAARASCPWLRASDPMVRPCSSQPHCPREGRNATFRWSCVDPDTGTTLSISAQMLQAVTNHSDAAALQTCHKTGLQQSCG